MASIMDRDPWSWTVSDVTQFFASHHARSAIAEMPGVELPPPEQLSSNFVNEGVTGAVLLLSVDDFFLRSHCSILTLAPRAAVMHCINKLRAVSLRYKSRNDPIVWAAPSQQSEQIVVSEESLEKLVDKPLVPEGRLDQPLAHRSAPTFEVSHDQAISEPMQLDEMQPTAAGTSIPVSTERAQSNVVAVKAQQGKKPRRLDPSAISQAASQSTSRVSQVFGHEDIERFLPRQKLPIDEIFFGRTTLGQECGTVEIDHPLYVHEGSNIKEFDDKTFQYVNRDLQPGIAAYISSKVRRSLLDRETSTVMRHERHAVATYPYGAGLQAERTKHPTQYGRRGRILFGGSRSAFMVRRRTAIDSDDIEHTGDPYITTRENEFILESGADEKGYGQVELSSEHEDLLSRWKEDENDLMSETNPTTEEEEDSDGRDDDTNAGLSDDDQAEEVDEDEFVSASEVNEIINKCIDECIARWNENTLPKLETAKAWTVWKQTKRSKMIRDALVQGANTRIGQLQSRLVKARRDMESNPWEEKSTVQRTCRNLDATVEDIQHERWKIDVWGRRQEPSHTSARKANHKHKATAPTNSQPQDRLPNLGSQDRLSVSPTRVSPPPPAESNDQNSDMEAERFHTPPGSPVVRTEDSPFIVPDDDHMQIDEPDEATAGAARDVDGRESTVKPSPEVQSTSLGHERPHNTPKKPSPVVSLITPTAATRSKDVSAEMPSPSALARVKQSRLSPAASVIDMTDVRSSPLEPMTPAHLRATAKKAGKGAKRGRLSGVTKSDELPSTSEADQWSFDELISEQRRDLVLKKLLRDMGQKNRESLWGCFQQLMFAKFVGQLRDALETITTPRDQSPPGEDVAETPRRADSLKGSIMKRAARLLLAFHFLRPDVCDESRAVPTDILAQPMPTEPDTKSFVQLLRQCLSERTKPMYSSPMPASFDDPIVIDTDDEVKTYGGLDSDDPISIAPRSVKKRKIRETDVKAREKRKAARARHEESQQQQSSNPAMLQSMVLATSNPGDKIINPLRQPNQEPIFIEANIASKMKSYQLEGVQFLWRELTSDSDDAQGCLLAHTMGLGKTMQTITLLGCVDMASQSASAGISNQLPRDLQLGPDRNNRSLKILILCPSSLIHNWRRELELWVDRRAFGGNIFSIESSTTNSGFMKDLGCWARSGGILLVGYPLFQKIVHRQAQQLSEEEEQSDAQKVAKVKLSNENIELARRILTQDAELVVADEAHHVKNDKSSTAVAAAKIRSNARIALTGTPMSNDVDEIYALITWVSPGFLGDKMDFGYYFGNPIKNGLYADSEPSEKRKSTIMLKSLHREIEPKVHRAGISVLKGELKPKVEFVITVELTEQQRQAYAGTVAALLGAKDLNLTALTSIFAWLGVLGLLTGHPRSFRRKLLTPISPKEQAKRAGKSHISRKSVNADMAPPEDAGSDPGKEAVKSNEGSPEVPGDESVYALGFTEAMVNALVQDLTDDIDPSLSAKTRLLQEILRLSKQCNDKVLIFSASIPTLDYLRDLLTRNNVPFGRIDGSLKMEERTRLLKKFQSDNGGLDVLLVSTRAGGQGLNIQAANRVIIFDFGFNPSWEEQAIGRAYRFGQQKPVFVYRFVAGGTFESNIYNTQLFKTSLASRVVDKKNPRRNAIRNTKEYLYPPKEVKHEDLTNELAIDLDPKVLSKIMEAQIARGDARDPSIDICNVRTMEVLQQEDPEAPLDHEELKQVEAMGATWKAGRNSALRPTATDSSSARATDAISSTAPVAGAGPNAHAGGMLSSTQGPAGQASAMPQPPGPIPSTSTSFPARDIRNGSGSGPSRTNVSMGGLPFAGPN